MKLLSGKIIMVVDDEFFIREVFRQNFEMSGATVIEAESGKKAMELLRAQSVDVVISDVRMANGDGIFLAKAILTELKDRPNLFFCSGFYDISKETQAELEVIEIFGKPFQWEKILAAVCVSLGLPTS